MATKKKATSVKIVWSENRTEGIPASFPSFKEANALLTEMARTAPAGGGYDKTGFEVVFEDGNKYEGRFDLTNEHTAGGTLLEDHILRHLNFYAGRVMDSDLPSHLTPEKYRDILHRIGEKHRDETIAFLDKYRIGDGTTNRVDKSLITG